MKALQDVNLTIEAGAFRTSSGLSSTGVSRVLPRLQGRISARDATELRGWRQ